MQVFHLKPATDWEVLGGTVRSQAAIMVIHPGQSEGGPDNRHKGSDQWLYVMEGDGEATVEETTVTLTPGDLLLVEAGERHEIRCTGKSPLVTLDLYAPPEYPEQ